jgi:addiction module HigA family antidote
MANDTIMPPVHPGEILLTEFLEPLELSQYQLARSIAVPARRINEIVHGQRRISADTALRLARFFGTSERFWMNLQSRYDLEIEKDRIGTALDDIQPFTAVSLRRPNRVCDTFVWCWIWAGCYVSDLNLT